MKKLFIIILLCFISGCEKESILNTVYISSIGIDYIEGEYIGYFYSPPAKDIGKNNDSNDEACVYVIKDKELGNVFDKLFDSDPVYINILHLKTMILSDNFKDINVLLNYFKYSTKVSYNFHVFITNDNLSDIYKYKSMSNVSNLYNFLNSPSLIEYEEHGITKCHFLNFANNYLNDKRYDIVPLVKIEKNSLKDDEFQLKIDGYSNTNNIYQSSVYKGINFLFNSNKEISLDNNISLLSNYKVKYSASNNIFNIDISYNEYKVSGDLDSNEFVISHINEYLEEVLSNEGSIYLIEQYNYLYKKNLDTNKYVVNIK